MSILAEITENEIYSLDQIDKDILDVLQKDGRISASSIAQLVGMSVPAIADRIKRLQDSGVIMSFTAVLNHRRVGLDVSAFITVISESSSHYNDVVIEANKAPEVIQCFTTTGNGSHVLLVVTKNMFSLEKLLRTIQSWPGVTRTETQMVLSSYKNSNVLKIP